MCLKEKRMKDFLDFYKDKVILITRGAGAIGSNLWKDLSKLEARLLIIIDDLPAAYE
jgi:UDP-glucose 4-epimerase